MSCRTRDALTDRWASGMTRCVLSFTTSLPFAVFSSLSSFFIHLMIFFLFYLQSLFITRHINIYLSSASVYTRHSLFLKPFCKQKRLRLIRNKNTTPRMSYISCFLWISIVGVQFQTNPLSKLSLVFLKSKFPSNNFLVYNTFRFRSFSLIKYFDVLRDHKLRT